MIDYNWGETDEAKIREACEKHGMSGIDLDTAIKAYLNGASADSRVARIMAVEGHSA